MGEESAAFADAGPADLPPGTCALRQVAGRPVLVARAADGRLFALEGRCSHALLSLEGARLRGSAVMCPHHGARFDLATGRALGPPASAPIATFAIREEAGRFEVRLP